MATLRRKFSLMCHVNNAQPDVTKNADDNVNLTLAQADNLVSHQLSLPHPQYLDEKAFYPAEITDSIAKSVKVHEALVKHGLILPSPATLDGVEYLGEGPEDNAMMTVNVAGITKDFANQVPLNDVHAQRKLVSLLFFWEEECGRWRKLEKEGRDILETLDSEKGCDQRTAESRLGALMKERILLPSQRGEE
ncbi:hypothetical protein BDV97DRAFT_286522 [Delphinella strobiligena]|nr:hypothetical protein BDV97DRAFT_286522 [Delphinella strobiligena]